jgi:hypothetical protein
MALHGLAHKALMIWGNGVVSAATTHLIQQIRSSFHHLFVEQEGSDTATCDKQRSPVFFQETGAVSRGKLLIDHGLVFWETDNISLGFLHLSILNEFFSRTLLDIQQITLSFERGHVNPRQFPNNRSPYTSTL